MNLHCDAFDGRPTGLQIVNICWTEYTSKEIINNAFLLLNLCLIKRNSMDLEKRKGLTAYNGQKS